MGAGTPARREANRRLRSGAFAALQRRDPVFVDAGTAGERVVARIRILLLCFLLLTQLAPSADPIDNLVGFSFLATGLGFALAVYLVATYYYRPWLGFVSSALDVTLVSLTLASFVVVGKPGTAINSKVVFEVYFLAIGCASLRYDWRVCALSGLLAVSEYATIVVYAFRHFSFHGAVGDAGFGWNVQVGRLVMLTAAALLSIAIVHRAQSLRRLSTTDRLTGLHNRGFFDDRLVEEENRAKRYQHLFSVAILDVDHFKRFNDTHGHAAGDAALVLMAETLRSIVRKSDVVSRYGGEEFALILPETGIEEAAAKLELIRRLVAATEIELPSGAIVHIDSSAGVACFPQDGEDGYTVLAAADARLYAAKRAGRGRVIATSGSTST